MCLRSKAKRRIDRWKKLQWMVFVSEVLSMDPRDRSADR